MKPETKEDREFNLRCRFNIGDLISKVKFGKDDTLFKMFMNTRKGDKPNVVRPSQQD